MRAARGLRWRAGAGWCTRRARAAAATGGTAGSCTQAAVKALIPASPLPHRSGTACTCGAGNVAACRGSEEGQPPGQQAAWRRASGPRGRGSKHLWAPTSGRSGCRPCIHPGQPHRRRKRLRGEAEGIEQVATASEGSSLRQQLAKPHSRRSVTCASAPQGQSAVRSARAGSRRGAARPLTRQRGSSHKGEEEEGAVGGHGCRGRKRDGRSEAGGAGPADFKGCRCAAAGAQRARWRGRPRPGVPAAAASFACAAGRPVGPNIAGKHTLREERHAPPTHC